ncbi:hypothetical protein AB0F16_01095 [Streptomyces tanashiensis]|uniref:hypothetical protein n=1 Tax=Streptomyces tanashiensis TaxID=67367 RepID=UPI0033CDC4A2
MTTTTNATQQPAPVPHHFVITLQTSDGRIATNDGTIPVIPGLHTRMQTYTAVREQIRQSSGLGACIVLFFALEPNQL